MSKNVYAVYDSNDGNLYQFAAEETTLAKDAILAFMEENSSALFGSAEGVKKDCMSKISEVSSVESLAECLTSWDLTLNIIQIK